MQTIHALVRQINRELVPQFEAKLRALLIHQDKEWLIEQIVRLTLDAHSLEEADRKLLQQAKARKRAERIERLQALCLDCEKLDAFIQQYQGYTQERLLREGYLLESF